MTPEVVFADAEVVVVDKPSGMPSVPARTPLDPPDVAVRLGKLFGPLEAVHRLDRDTSGLLVLARTRVARVALGRAFERGEVAKTYLAIVSGQPPDTSGELHLPLAPDRDRPPRQRIDIVLGKRAATRWRLLATAAADAQTLESESSLLEVEPLSGRSHQIRVHLAWLSCPIVGDRLYGHGEGGCLPLALHAAALLLPHPAGGRPLACVAKPPATAPWNRFSAAITAASAAWPSGLPSANSGRTGPDH